MQQPTSTTTSAVTDAPEQYDVEVQYTDSGYYFFVSVVSKVQGEKIPKAKKVLKDLGGVRNSRMGMYKFPTGRFDEVMNKLGENPTHGIADPRKTIKVSFEGVFQWPGEMLIAQVGGPRQPRLQGSQESGR
mgnify:CR=1 FL=1